MFIEAADSATATTVIAAAAVVLGALVTVVGSIFITRINLSAVQRQKEIDEAQNLQEYRRQLLEKRREERRDVYLRWIKTAQEAKAAVSRLSRESGMEKEKAFAAMRPLYDNYDELSLLDCPDDLVMLAAKIQKLLWTAIQNGRDRSVGGLLIEISNRMQADLSRDDDIISPHRRPPGTRFDLSQIGLRARAAIHRNSPPVS